MKKVFAILAIAGFMASCNNDAKTEGEKKDSTAAVVDSAKKVTVDSAVKVAVDSTVKKDSAAKM